jgi:hypothetical protein
MPPIFSGLHDNVLISKLYDQSHDILSQLSSLSRRLRPQHLARSAEGVPTTAQVLAKLGRLLRRQNSGQAGVIPSSYPGNESGPSPGAIAGIIIGSVLGFLFLLWLIWTCYMNRIVADEEIRERRHSHSRRTEQVIEIGRPPRRPERVIINRRSSLVDSSSDSDITVEEIVRRQRSGRDRPQNGVRYVNPDLPAGGNGHVEGFYVGKGSGSRRSRR